MNDHEYPIPVRQAVKTLIEICTYQDRLDLVEVLENAHAEYWFKDFDNWNGGTYRYDLHLGLSTRVFAANYAKISSFEEELLKLVETFDKVYENDHISGVSISPLSEDSSVYGSRHVPSEAQAKHLWEEGYFKLFLSHLVTHKVEVHNLKRALRAYGIDSFVARDDIQPSRQWQSEIELALRSMDSLVALLTTGFLESKWCDQEVGWALGRGVPVVPVRLGCDPHGFAGQFQAISGRLESPDGLAVSIFNVLKTKSETKQAIHRALPNALLRSPSFIHSIALGKAICEYKDYTESEKEVLWRACAENGQVYRTHNVTETIYDHIGRPPSQQVVDEIPF